MKSLVSVVIPTFNRSHFLGATLDSLLDQSYENWECIIVDDGSTDYTQELMEFYIKKDERIKYFSRPTHMPRGGNSSRNYGFEISTGEYINWFDDDDVMMSNFIKKKVEAFEKNIQFVISPFYYTNEKLSIESVITHKKTSNLFKDLILGKQIIITGAVMFRRNFLKEKRLFTPFILKGQETEFFSRLFYKVPVSSYKILSEPLFYYRGHNSGKTEVSKGYNNKYMFSLGYIYNENIKRGLELRDREILKTQYRMIVDLIFRGVENKDYHKSFILVKKLSRTFWKSEKMLSVLLIMIVSFSILTGNMSYKLKKFIRDYSNRNSFERLLFKG